MILVVLVVLNRYLKNEYPFNSFPMYAEPGGPSNYIIIADDKDTPLAVRKLTGFSSSDVKKMYIERRNRACDKLDIKPVDAPEDLKQNVVQRVVKTLRKAAEKRGTELPHPLRLIHVDIIQKGKTFHEDKSLLGEA